MISYGFIKDLALPFDDVVKRVEDELKKEGFGVLTFIDLKEKFREKLDIEFGQYVILGACNPTLAHKALTAEEAIGLMLPCNVVVYEKDDKIRVGIIKPAAAMGAVDNSQLKSIAETVEEKLKRVYEAL